MSFEIEAVLSQNITLVYDSLDLQTVDRNRLRDIASIHTQPMIMDTPEMIVAVYTTDSVFIQIGDRRIRVTVQQSAQQLGGVPIWDIAAKSSQLAPEAKSRLIAYGFNYDVGGRMTEVDVMPTLTRIFVPSVQELEDTLQAQLVSVMPRLLFQRGHTRYDLVIEPVDQRHIKAHFNTHFEWVALALPSPQDLRLSFLHEYEHWRLTLGRLLERGK